MQFYKENLGVFLKRIIAYLIDYVICSVAVIILTTFFMLFIPDGAFFYVLISLIFPIYYVFMFGKYGYSLGYKILKLKITNEDSSKVTYLKVFYRLLLTIASTIVVSLGYLMVIFTPKKQALQDYYTKIIVIEE